MKRIIVLIVILAFVISVMPLGLAYAGWKENYREKYSKRQLDPNSEKAKKLRRLANMDFKFTKWNKGEGGSKSFSGAVMSWKEKKQERDKFQGYTTNFAPANDQIATADEGRKSSTRTLTGVIQNIGESVGIDASGSEGTATTK